MMDSLYTAHLKFLDAYKGLVLKKYGEYRSRWPIISGFHVRTFFCHDTIFMVYTHDRSGGENFAWDTNSSEFESLVESVSPWNIDCIRRKIEKDMGLGQMDGVVVMDSLLTSLNTEADLLLQRHSFTMGVAMDKIFLSHKGHDKPRVRRFKATLEKLGFKVWLDEDSMHAGVELDRGIQSGINDSCAVVFFITEAFVDENFLSDEINYVKARKRANPKFAIITLVFEDGGKKPDVPALLQPYVWKTPQNELEALNEILKALPLEVGSVRPKD